MDHTDWIKALTDIGPFAVAIVWIVMWSLESIFSRNRRETCPQTELLERITKHLDKAQP